MEGGKEDGERERKGQKEAAKPRYKPRIMSLRERGTGLATSDSEPNYRNGLDRPIFRSFTRVNAAIISHSVVYEQRAG